MRIATCNIRCYPADDGLNSWDHRKEYALNLIRSLDAVSDLFSGIVASAVRLRV
jgi:hypothetical protein